MLFSAAMKPAQAVQKEVSVIFRIGVFSKLVRVSPRMLRYYEKCGLLVPAVVDRFTGYRSYTAGQILPLQRIAALRDAGFSIEEIAELLPAYGDRARMKEAAAKKAEEITRAIAAETARLEKLKTLTEHWKGANKQMVYEVEVKSLPEVKVLTLQEVIEDYSKEEALWEKLFAFVAEKRVAVSDQGAYSEYPDDEYKEKDVTVKISLPVSEFGQGEGNFVYGRLSAIPTAATIRFSGGYEGHGEAMQKLFNWLETNGYDIIGGLRGMALHDLITTHNPADFLVELQIPVARVC